MIRLFKRRMHFFITLILVGGTSNFTYSQYIDSDSLESLLAIDPPESVRVNYFIN